MPEEHRRPNGDLVQGYYCARCGAAGVNMLATGHGPSKCEANPGLVEELRKINSEGSIDGTPRSR